MERYNALIGVMIEKLGQTYKDLKYQVEGMESILNGHTEEERLRTPELLTLNEFLLTYRELMADVERRFPGIKDF
ncbi:hypothetical protein O9H85_09705 [Paenibacillus filicis]|uniref:Uncharacterized protein n=1 Tax=Paenibacillus gyeongsangnamensis TaxID=3388067 RepID=A0ABT4Q780_9BACL|nr:hypothetical protein [Paenibacillus filicis]MCZ8512683.1 hypothetical protein [Paenibacillus filicis]